MPLRSAKMKRRIFGFHRRVWCPKWTPASSRSCNWGCVMHSLWVSGARGRVSGAGFQDLTPDTRHLAPVVSPLRELEPLPRARATRLLALHHPRVARQQTLLPQLLAVPFVGEAQRPTDGEP